MQFDLDFGYLSCNPLVKLSPDFGQVQFSNVLILDIHCTFHRKFAFKLVIALKLIKVGSIRQYEVK